MARRRDQDPGGLLLHLSFSVAHAQSSTVPAWPLYGRSAAVKWACDWWAHFRVGTGLQLEVTFSSSALPGTQLTFGVPSI